MTINEYPSPWKLAQEREQAVQIVKDAWLNPGPYPEYHFRMQDSLRDQWPALASSLDRLAKIL